jgi:CBS domain-containing protein
MEIGVKVGDLMTRNYVYVSPSTSLKECAETLVKKRVGSLIVKSGENLSGILTEKDIIWAVVKKSVRDLSKFSAKDLAKRKVITIKPGADVMDALQKMRREKVRRLPVIENGHVIGMLTMNDILKIDPGLFEMIAENVMVREETEKLKQFSTKARRKEGTCEECGQIDSLYESDGEWVCVGCYNKK